MTINYRITGSLPATWEDFFCDGPYKNITLVSRTEHESCDFDDEPSDGSDGWLDIIVDVDVICEDIAKLAIAEALGIDNPDDIVIEQAGFCQSVSLARKSD